MDDLSKEAERARFEAALLASESDWDITRDRWGEYTDSSVGYMHKGWMLATQASAPADAFKALDKIEKHYGKEVICCGCPIEGHPGDGFMQPPDPPTCCQQFEEDVGMLCAEIRAHLRAQPPATTADTWPIAKLTVAGDTVTASFYTPGLPDGEHDVWPCPVALDHEAVAERAADLHDKASMPLADALELALSEAGAAGAVPAGWLPIEEAPKDGTQILLGRPADDEAETSAISTPGRWHEGYEDGFDYMGHDAGFMDDAFQEFTCPRTFGAEKYRTAGFQPTHYMPLPPAPQHQGGGK